MIGSVALLGYVTLARGGELLLARRNTRRLLERGGVESGAPHYPMIVGLHAAWLAGLWALAWDRPLVPAWVAVFALLQGLRLWTLATLGARWTTRIITVPGETLVRRGPYRFVSHPNYLVVIGELAVLPLAFRMPLFALAVTALNLSVLWVRIRAEEAALLQASGERNAGAMRNGAARTPR
jgi:methyltransferase